MLLARFAPCFETEQKLCWLRDAVVNALCCLHASCWTVAFIENVDKTEN